MKYFFFLAFSFLFVWCTFPWQEAPKHTFESIYSKQVGAFASMIWKYIPNVAREESSFSWKFLSNFHIDTVGDWDIMLTNSGYRTLSGLFSNFSLSASGYSTERWTGIYLNAKWDILVMLEKTLLKLAEVDFTPLEFFGFQLTEIRKHIQKWIVFSREDITSIISFPVNSFDGIWSIHSIIEMLGSYQILEVIHEQESTDQEQFFDVRIHSENFKKMMEIFLTSVSGTGLTSSDRETIQYFLSGITLEQWIVSFQRKNPSNFTFSGKLVDINKHASENISFRIQNDDWKLELIWKNLQVQLESTHQSWGKSIRLNILRDGLSFFAANVVYHFENEILRSVHSTGTGFLAWNMAYTYDAWIFTGEATIGSFGQSIHWSFSGSQDKNRLTSFHGFLNIEDGSDLVLSLNSEHSTNTLSGKILAHFLHQEVLNSLVRANISSNNFYVHMTSYIQDVTRDTPIITELLSQSWVSEFSLSIPDLTELAWIPKTDIFLSFQYNQGPYIGKISYPVESILFSSIKETLLFKGPLIRASDESDLFGWIEQQ